MESRCVRPERASRVVHRNPCRVSPSVILNGRTEEAGWNGGQLGSSIGSGSGSGHPAAPRRSSARALARGCRRALPEAAFLGQVVELWGGGFGADPAGILAVAEAHRAAARGVGGRTRALYPPALPPRVRLTSCWWSGRRSRGSWPGARSLAGAEPSPWWASTCPHPVISPPESRRLVEAARRGDLSCSPRRGPADGTLAASAPSPPDCGWVVRSRQGAARAWRSPGRLRRERVRREPRQAARCAALPRSAVAAAAAGEAFDLRNGVIGV
jgi:hypothetical protein